MNVRSTHTLLFNPMFIDPIVDTHQRENPWTCFDGFFDFFELDLGVFVNYGMLEIWWFFAEPLSRSPIFYRVKFSPSRSPHSSQSLPSQINISPIKYNIFWINFQGVFANKHSIKKIILEISEEKFIITILILIFLSWKFD